MCSSSILPSRSFTASVSVLARSAHRTRGDAERARSRAQQSLPPSGWRYHTGGSPGCGSPPGCLNPVQLAIDQNPQIPLCRAALQPLIPLTVRTARVAPCQAWNPSLALAKPHIAGDCPALCFVKISLQSLPPLDGVSHSFLFSIMHKWTPSALKSYMRVSRDNTEENRP